MPDASVATTGRSPTQTTFWVSGKGHRALDGSEVDEGVWLHCAWSEEGALGEGPIQYSVDVIERCCANVSAGGDIAMLAQSDVLGIARSDVLV